MKRIMLFRGDHATTGTAFPTVIVGLIAVGDIDKVI